MFKRLRYKFISISMLSVILVLGIIVAGINIASYSGTVKNADEILQILADNHGRFPENPEDRVMPRAGLDPIRGMNNPVSSPELQFETRYFSVLLDPDGNVLSSDTGMIAAISDSESESLAKTVFASSKDKGFESDYRFLKVYEGCNVRVIFYDCGRSLDSYRMGLQASVLVSLSSIFVIFLLILFFSGRIVRPVAESYEKQTRFITDAGHELKTPLAIINADADVILADGENTWADDIKMQVSRLTELTNSLIFLSKMQEDAPGVVLEDVDLSSLVVKSCDSFTSMFITGKKNLVKQIEDNIHIRGNESLLKELMSILLDNALKYSPSGGTTKVMLKQTSKGINLYVTNDTLHKIDKESAKKFFDRFYRQDPSRNSETGGHGIGLSIAQAIMDIHKGRIEASPEEGNGLTIKILFAS